MKRLISRWLTAITVTDIYDKRQILLYQSLLLGMGGIGLVGALIPFFAPITLAQAIPTALSILVIVLVALIALWRLRRGHLNSSVLMSSLGLSIVLSVLLVGTGLRDAGAILVGYSVPIALAGLLGQRGILLIVSSVSLGGVFVVLLISLFAPQLIGFAQPNGANYVGIVGGVVSTLSVLMLVIDRFGGSLRVTLGQARQRERELNSLREQLELQVQERTATLEQALSELNIRAAEQQQLLQTTRSQQALIRDISVPVLPVGPGVLVVPLVGALDAARLVMLRERTLAAVQAQRVRHVLLDITGVPVVDADAAQKLIGVIRALMLLGAEGSLIGVRPEVAQALVALGVDLASVPAFATLQSALEQGVTRSG